MYAATNFNTPFLVVALVVCAAAIVVPATIYWRRHNRRRRALASREAVAPDSWFESFLPVRAAVRPPLEELLDDLGECLGVPWTCLRPDDRLSGVLSTPGKGEDHALEMIDTRFEIWLERHNLPLRDYQADRLQDLLTNLARELDNRPVQPPP